MNNVKGQVILRTSRNIIRGKIQPCIRWLWLAWIVALYGLNLCCAASAGAASPAVEIEVIHEGSRSILAPQQWAEVLGKVGFSRVSIRSNRAGDELSVENIGSDSFPRYRVVAFLRNDRLVLPPAEQYNQRELGKIKAWLRDLQQGGIEAAGGTQGPFGLSPVQLDRARQQMAARVRIDTQGKDRAELIDRLIGDQRLPLTLKDRQREQIARSAAFPDSLEGLATGTALAVLLRPLGLGLQPIDGADRWRMIEKTGADPVWPIGWDSDQSAARTLPVLGKQVETQQVDLPLNEAMSQLAARMDIPILLDYRELASASVNPKANVTMRAGRFIHSAVLRQLLQQHRLTFAVRLDDAAQPFLWISTFKSLQPNAP